MTPSEKRCRECKQVEDHRTHYDDDLDNYHSFELESPEPKEEKVPSNKPEGPKEAEFICCELVHLDIHERAFAQGLSTQSKKVEALVRAWEKLETIILLERSYTRETPEGKGWLLCLDMIGTRMAEIKAPLSELQEGEGKG